MNINPLPVTVKILKPCSVAGREYHADQIVELNWIHVKHLEKQGQAERMINTSPTQNEILRDILIFTPVLRLATETVQALMSLEWDGALSLLLQRDNPTGKGKEDHLHQYQRGREAFLKGPYDAMLVIESDIIPPKDALKRLAALGADCAYGVYQFRGKGKIINIFELYPTNPRPRNTGESLSVKPQLLRRAIREGKFPCSGGGLGICLIRRRVLEKIEFRMDGESFCDTPFTDDVLHTGFSQMADMGVVCGHKDKDGAIGWPKYAEEGNPLICTNLHEAERGNHRDAESTEKSGEGVGER